MRLIAMMMPRLLILAVAAAAAAAAANSEAPPPAMQATLKAIEGAVDFFAKNADTVNLDGVIGLRTVEGQTGALLARYWTRLPLWLVARMTDLRDRAAAAARAGSESVQRRMPMYFANAGNMISEHFWDTFYPTRPLPTLPASPRVSAAEAAAAAAAGNFDEKFSDDCIHEFYGKAGMSRCSVSEKCWRAIVLPRSLDGYSLTHQLFYLMNGIQANCLTNLTLLARAHPPGGSDGTLGGIFDALCGRVFAEALNLESGGFPLGDRDLFMEQVGLCGLAGYTEAAQWRWLPALIRWQRPSGCYGEFPGEVLDPRNFQPGRYGNSRRRKRAEARMPRGCLAHRTSVAMDALMSYCRRILEQMLLDAGER